WASNATIRQITPRSIIAGLGIGSIVLFSNFQFGLQTGWVSMMSLPSALLAFALFKSLQSYLSYPFSDIENVFVQSISVAVGTGPLAFGLVGIVPAIEKFMTQDEAGGTGSSPIQFSTWDLIIWSAGLAFFGVFFAIPLRKQVIIREKLKFPSGSATATMIAVLHRSDIDHDSKDGSNVAESDDEINSIYSDISENINTINPATAKKAYQKNITLLGISFTLSSVYSLLSIFLPAIKNIPILGPHLAQSYLWTLQPSPAYIGQGVIMGLPTVSSMLFGCILGWGILAPLANHMDWATGPVDDWKQGAQGWILWISLGIMVIDSLVGFFFITAKILIKITAEKSQYELLIHGSEQENEDESDKLEDAPLNQQVSTKTTIIGLLISSTFLPLSLHMLFGSLVPIIPLIFALLLSLILSLLAVRCLGETDLNPVSGIGKLSQIVFALILPRKPSSVLINLIAGSVAEAGAQQAGDLMQDLKTGHLLKASPKAQFIAQMIGTLWSVFLSAIVYRLYNRVYEIPSDMFRIPTAVIWIDCARLVTGQGLPPMAWECTVGFAVIFGVISLLKTWNRWAWTKWLPSGVAVGVGIFNTPGFTLARFVGGVIAWWWMRGIVVSNNEDKENVWMIIGASGLILGEGVFSVVGLIIES
ncbi:OPT superfamily oligopeptide transporter, partial [Nadsonia fulvescens var. elongata DSM 6958]